MAEKREILFRAYHKEYGMIYPEEIFRLESAIEGDLNFFGSPAKDYETDQFIFLQHTGRKDKHDKDIYEKDIVRNDHGTGWIEWDNEMSMWRVQSFTWWCELYKFENPEIIGNIYENKDLLK